ncbi:aspartate kinase [Sesbania bispinosa]|nr:aspartate kinase [Sesbania bispinosa]
MVYQRRCVGGSATSRLAAAKMLANRGDDRDSAMEWSTWLSTGEEVAVAVLLQATMIFGGEFTRTELKRRG